MRESPRRTEDRGDIRFLPAHDPGQQGHPIRSAQLPFYEASIGRLIKGGGMRSAARLGSHPIHPMFVAFPVGLFIAGYIFDLIGVASGNAGLWGAGWYCIIGG